MRRPLQAEAWYQPALKKIPEGEQIVTVCALPLYHIFAFNGRESGAHHLSLVGLPRGWDVATAKAQER